MNDNEAAIAAILADNYSDAVYNREMEAEYGDGPQSPAFGEREATLVRAYSVLETWDRVCGVPASQTAETVAHIVKRACTRVYGD